MNIVELNQVEKHYQGVKALTALNLSVREGEVLGLFGHNGAGKTTTIKLILGLISASRGEVRVFGQDPTQSGALQNRYKLGFLQENVCFYEQLSGLEVLEYFARLKRVGRQRCPELLQQVGLAEAARRKVKTYSKGMRQRLGLAQALLGEPKLLLLDEPTVGLDPIATREFYRSISELKRQGCTLILCSHVLPGVERYLDRALILGQGKLLAEGSLEQLRHQAQLPVTFQLKGNGLQLPAEFQTQASVTPQGGTVKVALADKMRVLRQLSDLPGVTDLEQHLPSLEDLYTHFNQSRVSGEILL